MADPIIKKAVVSVYSEATMEEAINAMLENEVSSILIRDENEVVVGILTERDIVRKFTMLEVEDKFQRKVSTMMTRPVVYVGCERPFRQAAQLFLKNNIRHFPIVEDIRNPKEVMGIISIADIVRRNLQPLVKQKGSKKRRLQVALIARSKGKWDRHILFFKDAGIDLIRYQSFNDLYDPNRRNHSPLLFDLDGLEGGENQKIISAALKYPGLTIFTSSNPLTVQTYRKYLKEGFNHIAIKPLDLSFIMFLLTRPKDKK